MSQGAASLTCKERAGGAAGGKPRNSGAAALYSSKMAHPLPRASGASPIDARDTRRQDSVTIACDLADNPDFFANTTLPGDNDFSGDNGFLYPTMNADGSLAQSDLLSAMDEEIDELASPSPSPRGMQGWAATPSFVQTTAAPPFPQPSFSQIDELASPSPSPQNMQGWAATPAFPSLVEQGWAAAPSFPPKRPLADRFGTVYDGGDPFQTDNEGYCSDPETDTQSPQIGGGYRRHYSATPPPTLTPTRLRANRRPTAKAKANIATASPPEPAPPPARKFLAQRREPTTEPPIPGTEPPITRPANLVQQQQQQSTVQQQSTRSSAQGATTKRRAPVPAAAPHHVPVTAPQHAGPPPARPLERAAPPPARHEPWGSTSQKRPASAAPVDDPAPKRVAFAAPPADPSDPRLANFYEEHGFDHLPLPPPPSTMDPRSQNGASDNGDNGDYSVPDDGDNGGDNGQHGGPDPNAHDRVNLVLPQRGRFSSTQQDALQLCFVEVDKSMAACAAAIGLPQTRVLNAYLRQTEGLKARGENLWNLYQSFANSTPALRLAERRRVDPYYTPPSDADTPALDTTLLAQAFTRFKRKYTQEQAEEILTTSAELAKNESEIDQTLRQRQNKFHGWKAKFANAFAKMFAQDNFEAFMCFNGVWLNEDTELGAVITTPGMTTFLEDISSCESDFIAAAKLTAYTNSMKSIKVACVPAADASTAASAAVTVAADDAASTAAGPDDVPAPSRAKPKPKSCSAKNEKQKVTNNKHQNNIKAARLRLGTACTDDTGVDIFNKDNSNFASATVAGLLASSDLICVGWPADVRLFSFYPAGKGTGAWRHPELQSLNAALDARDGGPEQGLRFEKRKRLSGSYVIFSHDYRKPPPTGPATEIKRHWRSSCGSLLPCLRDDNAAHEVDYDLRHANTIVSIGAPLTADSSKQYAPRPSRKPSKSGKGKRKAKQDSDSDSSDFEPEEEEPMSPPLKRRREGSTRPSEAPSAEAPSATVPVQEGGGRSAPRRTTRRAAAAAAPATAAPVPLFMSDDEDDVPIRGKSRRQRTTTVRSESESESATEDHAAPQARTQLAVPSPKQVMDFVEIPVSPVRKSTNDERDTRHLFNGTGQLIGRASQHDDSNAYQWDAPPAPPPRPPPHQWDPPLPTSGPPHPHPRVKRPTAASEMPPPPPPPAASSSASLQRPPLPAPVASSSAPRRRPPPPPPPASLSRDSSMPPSGSALGAGRGRPRYSTPPITTLDETERSRPPPRTHAPPPSRRFPAAASSSADARIAAPAAPDALVVPVNPVTPADRVAPASSSTAPIDPLVLQLLGALRPEQISAIMAGLVQGGAPP
ncbi:hypothetical protein B0H14DRAFT_2575171 [Mycena olivaceomarginata]|nr:hypothetical protein B0H14DRAFT_2575171 [Mycena olivaceomarginata]